MATARQHATPGRENTAIGHAAIRLSAAAGRSPRQLAQLISRRVDARSATRRRHFARATIEAAF